MSFLHHAGETADIVDWSIQFICVSLETTVYVFGNETRVVVDTGWGISFSRSEKRERSGVFLKKSNDGGIQYFEHLYALGPEHGQQEGRQDEGAMQGVDRSRGEMDNRGRGKTLSLKISSPSK